MVRVQLVPEAAQQTGFGAVRNACVEASAVGCRFAGRALTCSLHVPGQLRQQAGVLCPYIVCGGCWCNSIPYCIPTAPCAVQVCRGTAVMLVAPTQGLEEIANPFAQAQEEAEQ